MMVRVVLLASARRVRQCHHPEPALAMWVPPEMREDYSDAPRGEGVRTFPNAFKGVARYGRFRRFTARSQETVTVPAAEPLP
jgi:hypothetical protein